MPWLSARNVLRRASIATVLSDMDAELAALEARRNTFRALNQGMIQERSPGGSGWYEGESAHRVEGLLAG